MSDVLVVDASIVVDLLGRFRPEPIEVILWADDTVLAAPEVMQVESLQALRRLDLSGAIPGTRRSVAEELGMLPIRLYRHQGLLPGIWALRHNLNAYDAAYVALARVLKATLVTRDEKLANVPGLGVPVEVPI